MVLASEAAGPVARLPVLGVVARRRTYRHLALLLALFPLGVVNFVFLVTGLSVGFALTPFLVGIPILGLVLVGVTWLAAGYGRVLSAVADREVSPEGFRFGPDGFWAGLREVAGSARSWVLLVALFATFPVGLAAFVAVVVVFSVALALLFAPLVAPLPVTSYRLSREVLLDTPLELAGASVAGLALLLAGLWFVTVAGEAVVAVSTAVLEFDAGRERQGTSAGSGADQDR